MTQHGQAAFRTRKRIAVIAKLNRLERSFQGKFSETAEDLFHINSRKTNFSTSRIAIPASKRTGFSNGNKHTILLHFEQDSPAHTNPPYIKNRITKHKTDFTLESRLVSMCSFTVTKQCIQSLKQV